MPDGCLVWDRSYHPGSDASLTPCTLKAVRPSIIRRLSMKMRFTIHAGSRIRLLVMPLALLAAVAWGLTSTADAYEVWITDQSDTGKDSGGFLYIYNGGKLAANH